MSTYLVRFMGKNNQSPTQPLHTYHVHYCHAWYPVPSCSHSGPQKWRQESSVFLHLILLSPFFFKWKNTYSWSKKKIFSLLCLLCGSFPWPFFWGGEGHPLILAEDYSSHFWCDQIWLGKSEAKIRKRDFSSRLHGAVGGLSIDMSTSFVS